MSQDDRLRARLSTVKHVVLVLSGKGGVGKSSIAVQLALSFLNAKPGARVGLLDIDLTGPSLPRMLGVENGDIIVNRQGLWDPVKVCEGPENGLLSVVSLGFLLKNTNDSVVWRGPKKTAMVRQFLCDVHWGNLDYLIVDTPPGTSDEHISLVEALAPAISNGPSSLDAVLVSTPQAVSVADVARELSFARKTAVPVVGLIENMSGYVCPHCGEVTQLFGKGGAETFCRLEEEKKERGEVEDGCKFLGRVPVDREVVILFDHANKQLQQQQNENSQQQQEQQESLLTRYSRTPSSEIMKDLAKSVSDLVNARSSA